MHGLMKESFQFGDKLKIMGIVNVTPDSFYDGGKYSYSLKQTVDHAMQLIDDGTDILDIGGESSRPGASPLSAKDEIQRIVPVIEAIRKRSRIPISVDTYKVEVAKEAIDAGADWINDISGLRDKEMVDFISSKDCPVIIMHMQGDPQTMQENPVYNNVVDDLLIYFEKKIKMAKETGIKKIIIDPGIGFGKTVSHNLEILNRINEFKQFEYPVMIGASRKSFIGGILNEEVENRLAGSLAVLGWLVLKNIDIIRVHDVRESVQFQKIITSIRFGVN